MLKKIGLPQKTAQILLGLLFAVLIIELVLIGPLDLKEQKKKDLQNDPAAAHQPVTSIAPHGADVEQLMEGIHYIETKSENKQWELWADRAVGFREKDNLSLQKVKAQFFTDDGVTFNVTGEEGAVGTGSKNVVVDGGVVTQSSNGYVFKTTKMEYNSKSRHLSSPMPVEVSGPRDESGQSIYIKGQKMSADLAQGYVIIEKDVYARKTGHSNQKLAVTSQRAQLSGKEKSVRFSGTVIIDMNGMKITGPDALFKYGAQSDLLESIELEGGVKVSDFSKWATSEKLSINLSKNEFVFDGKPRVVQDNDELRGDRIVFLEGGKKVQVRNAKIKVSRESLNQKTGPKDAAK